MSVKTTVLEEGARGPVTMEVDERRSALLAVFYSKRQKKSEITFLAYCVKKHNETICKRMDVLAREPPGQSPDDPGQQFEVISHP